MDIEPVISYCLSAYYRPLHVTSSMWAVNQTTALSESTPAIDVGMVWDDEMRVAAVTVAMRHIPSSLAVVHAQNFTQN